MKVMVIVKATKDSEAGVMPSEQLLNEMGKYNEELSKAGVMLAGEGLHPSSKGARVRFSGANRTVSEGPFPQTTELIAGYWIWQVKSMAEAIDWVKRCPNPMLTDSDIEIRPIFEAADFGDALKPDLKESEAALRAKTLGLGDIRFENGKELIIAGIKQSYMFASRASIPSQWARFSSYLGKVPGQVGKVAYGVCSNYSQDQGFDYLSGVEATGPAGMPAELFVLQLPAQRYAIFPHDEHVTSIPKTIDKIWKTWLPDSGLKVAESPCFERYSEKFDPQTGLGGMEIWIPIQH